MDWPRQHTGLLLTLFAATLQQAQITVPALIATIPHACSHTHLALGSAFSAPRFLRPPALDRFCVHPCDPLRRSASAHVDACPHDGQVPSSGSADCDSCPCTPSSGCHVYVMGW